MRLKTHVTASALIRRAQAMGLFATVMHRGDPDGGVLWIKVRDARTAALWAERHEGGFGLRTDGFVDEGEADGMIVRERDFDRDLWLIEIEGADGAALLAD